MAMAMGYGAGPTSSLASSPPQQQSSMPDKLPAQEQEEYDLDAALDDPVVSNFLGKDRETISPRELTFRKDEMRVSEDASIPLATVVAFVMACCLAHWIIVTSKSWGWAAMDELTSTVQDFFTKHSITVPDDAKLL